MSMEANEFLKSEYIVCFFDVLGQKDWMKDVILGGKINPVKQYELDRLAFLTNDMRDIFRESARNYARDKGFSISEGLAYGVQQFSDSTILYMRRDIEFSPGLFHIWLLDLSLRALEWQSMNLYFRGGITCGAAWHVAGGQICGPALDEAGDLEGDTAFYQRIVFSDGFVQWVERELQNDNISKERKDDFYAVKSMMQWESDMECSLNIFNPTVPRRMIENGLGKQFSAYYKKAKSNVDYALENLNCEYSWKYVFLDDSFRIHDGYLAEYVNETAGMPSFDSHKFQAVKVGRFFVYYLKLLPLYGIPPRKDWLESGRFMLGVSPATPRTQLLLKEILSLLSQWRQHLKDSSFVSSRYGVQHVANYIMVYVEDDGDNAVDYFMKAVLLLQQMHILAMADEHFIEGSLASGFGWTIDDDCLCGPIVGIADAMATKKVPYPRVTIQKELCEIIRNKISLLNLWPRVRECIMKEVDGFCSWDVFTPDVWETLHRRGVDVHKMATDVYAHYRLRQMLMWHFLYRSNESSRFARQISLLLLRFKTELQNYGLGRCVESGDRIVGNELEKNFGLKSGDPPWILSKYVSVPDFPTRGKIGTLKSSMVPTLVESENAVNALLKTTRQ